ncbi:unnamed protein product [Chironomus riparius]|uniref:Uncharacterized protein n=1 Tax=Chironomus riparius TaxID=315576 RepID=A0A9N9RTQ9_9DIPT|nr:unnamed protein product [Chironomus riparius]
MNNRNIKTEPTENPQNSHCQNPRQPQQTPRNQNCSQEQNQNRQEANPTSNNQRSRERSQTRAPRDRSQPRNVPNSPINANGAQFMEFIQSFRRGMVVGNFEVSGTFCMYDDSSSDEDEVAP